MMRRQVIIGLETLFGLFVRFMDGISVLSHRRFSRIRAAASKGLFRILRRLDRSTPGASAHAERHDLVFLVPPKAQGWILEGLCKDLQQHYPGKSAIHYRARQVPEAHAYFFPHYALYARYLEDNPRLWGCRALVWFTHPRRLGLSDKRLVDYLDHASRIVCMSPTFYPVLEGWGIEREKLTSLIGAADDELFRPHRRGGGAVGFCTAYYERKAPDTVLEIVRGMPHRRFLLVGRNWCDYPHFADLQACPNFRYVEAPYSEYPELYAQMDVFVSVSRLEGGPIPLIEAMMSNCVPVASRTGFAPQIIDDGRNGFLFDIDAPTAAICALIEKAFAVEIDVSATARHLTWKNCARQLAQIAETTPLTHGSTGAE